jgi:hypothetical protein
MQDTVGCSWQLQQQLMLLLAVVLRLLPLQGMAACSILQCCL